VESIEKIAEKKYTLFFLLLIKSKTWRWRTDCQPISEYFRQGVPERSPDSSALKIRRPKLHNQRGNTRIYTNTKAYPNKLKVIETVTLRRTRQQKLACLIANTDMKKTNCIKQLI